MQLLKRLLLFVALATAATAIFPAHAQSYRLGDTSCEQGSICKVPVTVTGARTKSSHVTLYVGVNSDSAKPGVDYAPSARAFQVLPTDTKLTLDVPTLINDAIPGPLKQATTKLVINSGGVLLDGTGIMKIVDSDVAMQTCWDDSIIPVTSACPDRPTQVCWDGSVIFADLACPVRPTKPCWDGSIIFADLQCPPLPPVQCSDGSTVPAGQTCPQPPVDPVTGLPPIASNFDISTTLMASWGSGAIPPVNSNDIVGAFRFICGAGAIKADDPIVYPGQPGRAHLHQFYGNTGANANSTFQTLRASGDSTCNNMGNGTAANRSAYWLSAMLDGKGHVVQPDYVQVYYKRGPDDAPGCFKNGVKICIGIPNGVRFIQGFNQITGAHSVQPGWFKCGASQYYQNKEAMSLLNSAKCPVGTNLEVTMSSLKCFNGQIDSPDHMAHFSGMVAGACPPSHPYLLPQFTISVFYSIRTGDDVGLWSLSSDHMFPTQPRGGTLHLDYFEAWDDGVKGMWQANCVGKKLNCSGGDLGNGKQLKGAAKPVYNNVSTSTNPVHLVPLSTLAQPAM